MKFVIICLLLVWTIVLPVSALEIEAPVVPDEGRKWMPETIESFGQALFELIGNIFTDLNPEIKKASQISLKLLCIVVLTSVLQILSGPVKAASNLAGIVSIASTLLLHTNSMITLGVDTVKQISDYSKLLLPVMSGAMAAQGGITSSAALYAGTAMFNAILSNIISSLLIPAIYLYIAVSVASTASEEDMLKRFRDMIKNASGWILKTLLMVFTTYLGLTGVVSGATDAAALKATKVTISSFVPVVGGILSDASEAVLVSVGVMKNAAGIYGILAVLAVFLHPFLQIAIHYLALKLTGAVCSILGNKVSMDLIDCFSTAMGYLLGITASCCMMVLVSTVCFMRGVQ